MPPTFVFCLNHSMTYPPSIGPPRLAGLVIWLLRDEASAAGGQTKSRVHYFVKDSTARDRWQADIEAFLPPHEVESTHPQSVRWLPRYEPLPASLRGRRFGLELFFRHR